MKLKLSNSQDRVWSVNFLLLLTGTIFVLCGLLGEAWASGGDNTEGLWRDCRPECVNREHVLGFEKFSSYRDLDSILLAMIFSTLAAFASIGIAILMLTQRDQEQKWACSAILLTLFSFIAAISCLSSVIYTAAQFSDIFSLSDAGWSLVLSWIAAILLCVSFALSCYMLCTYPKDHSELVEENTIPRKPGEQVNKTVSNKGYDETYD